MALTVASTPCFNAGGPAPHKNPHRPRWFFGGAGRTPQYLRHRLSNQNRPRPSRIALAFMSPAENVTGYLDNVTRPFLLHQTISRSRPGYILSQFSHRFTS